MQPIESLEIHPARPRPAHAIRHEMLGDMRVPDFADVEQAAEDIVPHVVHTPLLRSSKLDAIAGAPVWLKAENLQVTGSFKARGAFNALLSLRSEQRAKGVIAHQPVARAKGIETVIVNGTIAWSGAESTGARAGAVIRRNDRSSVFCLGIRNHSQCGRSAGCPLRKQD